MIIILLSTKKSVYLCSVKHRNHPGDWRCKTFGGNQNRNNNEEQQRTDCDEQHKEGEQEDDAEGKPKTHSSRSKCSTQGG